MERNRKKKKRMFQKEKKKKLVYKKISLNVSIGIREE